MHELIESGGVGEGRIGIEGVGDFGIWVNVQKVTIS